MFAREIRRSGGCEQDTRHVISISLQILLGEHSGARGGEEHDSPVWWEQPLRDHVAAYALDVFHSLSGPVEAHRAAEIDLAGCVDLGEQRGTVSPMTHQHIGETRELCL